MFVKMEFYLVQLLEPTSRLIFDKFLSNPFPSSLSFSRLLRENEREVFSFDDEVKVNSKEEVAHPSSLTYLYHLIDLIPPRDTETRANQTTFRRSYRGLNS